MSLASASSKVCRIFVLDMSEVVWHANLGLRVTGLRKCR
jgi:hypothetical protein